MSGGLAPKRDRKPTVKFSAAGSTSTPPTPSAEVEMKKMKAKYERKIKAMEKKHAIELMSAKNYYKWMEDYKKSAEEEKKNSEKWKEEAHASKEKVEKLEDELNEWRKTEDHAVVEKMINEAREQAKTQREIAMGYLATMAKGQEDFLHMANNGKICEICMHEYGSSVTPRVLPCGHTVCESCVGKLTDKMFKTMRCPFDRSLINMAGRSAKDFPKNFWILNK